MPAPYIGFDADQDCSGVAAAAIAAGASFVCRYLKNLIKTEVDALHAAGLSIVLIWEHEAERALAGYEGGLDDGLDARTMAMVLGAPEHVAVFATVDFDPTLDQQKVVLDYLRAFALRGMSGNYASGAICQACIDGGIGSYSWLAGGMGMRGSVEFAASGRASIIQDVGDKQHLDLGIAIDSDTAYVEDYGAWQVPAPMPMPAA